MATHRHNSTGLPGEALAEIHDLLSLSLDASERPEGYSQTEREARSYMRRARRLVERLTTIQSSVAPVSNGGAA